MAVPLRVPLCSRRHFLAAAAAAALPFASHAVGVYTPHELAQAFEREVRPRLQVPPQEAGLYGLMAELQLVGLPVNRQLLAPQYVLVVDRNPEVQAAFVFWRLIAGSYRLVGAAPASTGGHLRAGALETPVGVFALAHGRATAPACPPRAADCGARSARMFDFGWQRTRAVHGAGAPARLHLRLLAAADPQARAGLGSACSDGCIVLPPSLLAFLDRYGVLDGADPGRTAPALAYPGRHLFVLDSEREDRPDWSPLPEQLAEAPVA